MASPSVNPAPPDASEELSSLVQTLHEQGLLRLANDLAASHAQWMPAVGDLIDESADIDQWRSAMPAFVEFAGLLQAMHQQGLLRFANQAVASQEQWAPALGDILEDSVDIEQWRQALPAFSEIASLLHALHQQGLLRFANEMLASRSELMQTLAGILDDTLDDEGTRKALENLSVVFTTMLTRIEPGHLSKLLFALGDSLECVATYKPDEGAAAAPGFMGAFRMFKDESLWRALTPIIEALKVFGTELEKQADHSSATPDGPATRT